MMFEGKRGLNLHCFSDNDWLGDPETRWSKTGEVFFMSGALISTKNKWQLTLPSRVHHLLQSCSRHSVHLPTALRPGIQANRSCSVIWGKWWVHSHGRELSESFLDQSQWHVCSQSAQPCCRRSGEAHTGKMLADIFVNLLKVNNLVHHQVEQHMFIKSVALMWTCSSWAMQCTTKSNNMCLSVSGTKQQSLVVVSGNQSESEQIE